MISRGNIVNSATLALRAETAAIEAAKEGFENTANALRDIVEVYLSADQIGLATRQVLSGEEMESV